MYKIYTKLFLKKWGVDMPKFIPVENVNLNEVINLTEEQAKGRYNVGRTNLKEIADKTGLMYALEQKDYLADRYLTIIL